MATLLKLISLAGLALTVVPAFLVFAGTIEWETHATLMAVGTVLWFITAPTWMGREEPKLWFWKKRRPI
jgi:hypothetical protein